jgi:cytoskeletal protein RodZ
MAGRLPTDFGRSLREARERRGLSLRQIANSTKIAMSVLEALERNDLSRVPGGIFSRAFVRAYAVEVGLDPDETMQAFIAGLPEGPVSSRYSASATQAEDHQAVEGERRTAATFVRLVALSVPIAAAMIYFGISGRSGEAPAPAVELRSVAAASAPAAGLPVVQTASTLEVPAGRLRVSLSALRTCLVSVSVDGGMTLASLLQAGEQRTIDAQREIVLRIGDASALSVTINGVEAKPLGGEGEVVTTRLNLTNFKDYLSTR